MTISLQNFGLHQEVLALLQANPPQHSNQDFVLGRVTLEHKRLYRIMTEQGEVLASISGKMDFEAWSRVDYPCVGDWVYLSVRIDEQRGTIHQILPRKSSFVRKQAGVTHEEQLVATNVDTVFLVTTCNREFNVRRLERYLVMAWESGAKPVIICNKRDLCPDISALQCQIELIAPGVPIHFVSAVSNIGIEQLEPYLCEGETVALIGSSGVGKSTLTNRLLGTERQLTQTIRGKDDKGRHTTTYRELIPLPQGGCLIDTPGMRGIKLGATEIGLEDTFEEIERFAQQCRFPDCRHEQEPGCAIQDGLVTGTISQERFASYRKLQRELAYHAQKVDKRLELLQKNRRKQAQKNYRKYRKF